MCIRDSTETRHLPAAEAYAVIAKLTREAMSAGVFSIYKKTDSALRGNIGAELSALLKTSGERQLSFLPAFPQIDRVTRDGVHYISGVPVTESPFGIDPFEPVRHARVTELIGEQTDVPAHSFPTLKEGEAVPEPVSYTHLDVYKRQLLSTATLRSWSSPAPAVRAQTFPAARMAPATAGSPVRRATARCV